MRYIIVGRHLDPLPGRPEFEYLGPFEDQAQARTYITEHFVLDASVNAMDFSVQPMYDPVSFHDEQMART